MGFLVFLKKSRFFMQSRFRLDFGAQKTKNRRCRGRGLDPFFLSFLLIFYLFFSPFFERVLDPLLSDFRPLGEDQKTAKSKKKSEEKTMESSRAF